MRVEMSDSCLSCGEAYINGVCGNCGDIQNKNTNYKIGNTERQDIKPIEEV